MAVKVTTLPKLNYVSNFNFFYHNTKKKFFIEQNFIGNQFLNYRSPISSKRFHNTYVNLSTSTNIRNSQGTNSILENVATKVLNCQDADTMKYKQDQSKIPFKVTPVTSTNKVDISSESKKSLMSHINPYIKLTKPNLTILVTLSSICSYAISPFTASMPELIFLTLGTALCSGAANAINMGREPEFDSKMPRTVGRPVVRGLVTPKQAYQFATVTGSIGSLMLYAGVNPTVSFLGVLNIVLYSWVYTSLKRKSIINTWVGAIVGAIPPLMGWAASSPLTHPGAWCLAGLLYAWQFPHFNALSHNIADQYKNAGYVMTAAENPKLNARVALRYSLLMFPFCFGLSYFGITDWVFQFDSAIMNSWLAFLAFKFWKQQKKNYRTNYKPTAEDIALSSAHAKKLFWGSVWQLPVILILAMLHKKGQWDRLFDYLGFGKNKEKHLIL